MAQRWRGRKAASAVVAAVALLAALAFVRSPEATVDILLKVGAVVGVMAGLYGAVTLFTGPAVRSMDRAQEERWRTVCHVTDEDHRHGGTLLSGTWKGRPFQARAIAVAFGGAFGTITDYRLSMPTAAAGPAWRARRKGRGTARRRDQRWTVRSGLHGARQELLEARLLSAIAGAEQRTVRVRRRPRLAFHPRTAEVVYEDRCGAVPCAEDLVVHLDLVRRAVAIHDDTSEDGPGQPG